MYFVDFERIFLKSIDFLVESNGHISSDPENNVNFFLKVKPKIYILKNKIN